MTSEKDTKNSFSPTEEEISQMASVIWVFYSMRGREVKKDKCRAIASYTLKRAWKARKEVA